MSATEHSMQRFHRAKVVPSITLSEHRVFKILREADYSEKLKILQRTPQFLKDAINMALQEYKKRRKLRNTTAQQTTKKYERKLLSEDEAFCIKGSYVFPLAPEQIKVFCAPLHWCLQSCDAFARARLLGALQWEHSTECRGAQGLTKHPALQQPKALSNPG